MGRGRPTSDLTGMQFRRLTVLGPAGVPSAFFCGEFAAHARIILNKWQWA